MRDLRGLQIGHYLVNRLVGSGSMGDVYLVEHTYFHHQVALKVLRTDFAVQKEYFRREAHVTVRLKHPNILPIYDYGIATIQGATVPYIVMPYLPGWFSCRLAVG